MEGFAGRQGIQPLPPGWPSASRMVDTRMAARSSPWRTAARSLESAAASPKPSSRSPKQPSARSSTPRSTTSLPPSPSCNASSIRMDRGPHAGEEKWTQRGERPSAQYGSASCEAQLESSSSSASKDRLKPPQSRKWAGQPRKGEETTEAALCFFSELLRSVVRATQQSLPRSPSNAPSSCSTCQGGRSAAQEATRTPRQARASARQASPRRALSRAWPRRHDIPGFTSGAAPRVQNLHQSSGWRAASAHVFEVAAMALRPKPGVT
mmetsp:Transcript_68806/g.201517  ORF Transcript_68806/g.201517 Transcript_68806/m.201517 type:complete len:266 (+) Transcript_68806:98-895(+)